jgi:uncharacterized protein YjbI with pentapeptide repeats
MTGADLSATQLEDCRFRGCRIDLASFRFAKLEAVRFEECVLAESDFYGATFSSVVFEGCDLTRAVWAEARFERSELRGCDIGGAVNPEQLRGVRMPWQDVVAAAGELAAALGIEIVD